MLDDQDVRGCADDATRFPQDQLYQPRVLAHGVRQFEGLLTRDDGREIDLSPFGLGYNLLCEDQYVIWAQLQVIAPERLHGEAGEIIATFNLRKVPQGDQVHFNQRPHASAAGPARHTDAESAPGPGLEHEIPGAESPFPRTVESSPHARPGPSRRSSAGPRARPEPRRPGAPSQADPRSSFSPQARAPVPPIAACPPVHVAARYQRRPSSQ